MIFFSYFLIIISIRENQEEYNTQAISFGGEIIYLYLIDPFFSILKFFIRI